MSGISFTGARYVVFTDEQVQRILDADLSGSEVKLLLTIGREVSGRDRPWFIPGGMDELQRRSALSRACCFRSLARLVETGLIVRVERVDKRNADCSNCYIMPSRPVEQPEVTRRASTVKAIQARSSSSSSSSTAAPAEPNDLGEGRKQEIFPFIGEAGEGRTDATLEGPNPATPLEGRTDATPKEYDNTDPEIPLPPTLDPLVGPSQVAGLSESALLDIDARIVRYVLEDAPRLGAHPIAYRASIDHWNTAFGERIAGSPSRDREQSHAQALSCVEYAVRMATPRENVRIVLRRWFIYTLHRAGRPAGWSADRSWSAAPSEARL